MTTRESLAVGVLMNTRGLVELIILNIGLDAGVLTEVRERLGWGGGGVTHFMHSRSLETIDPRIPAMPGPSSASDFHPPGRHRLHRTARSAVRYSASRVKGESCILLRTTCEADFGG